MDLRWTFSVLLSAIFAVGCEFHRHQPDSAGAQWYVSALESAPAVVKYKNAITSRCAWMVDEETPSYVILAVGEDMPDHFLRGLTVKVLRTGDVYVLETTGDGEEYWRLDRRGTKDNKERFHDRTAGRQ